MNNVNNCPNCGLRGTADICPNCGVYITGDKAGEECLEPAKESKTAKKAK